MIRILTAVIAVTVAFALSEPASASRSLTIYGEKGAGNVEANLWRRHVYPYGYEYRPYAYYEP
jgi:hypothetical protein